MSDERPPRVRRWNRGDLILHSRLNETVDALNRGNGGVRPPRQEQGISRSFVRIQQFRIKSVAADHLVCRTWDGTTEGLDDINVAKAYLLRRTPFDGFIRGGITYIYSSDIERNADNGSENEDQVVVPNFVVNDIIYGTRNLGGGTGVTGADWLDLNVDARAWAKDDSP